MTTNVPPNDPLNPDSLSLVPVELRPSDAEKSLDLPLEAREALDATRLMYAEGSFQPPWISYIALIDGIACGLCAFKSPPTSEGVEIAYFTLPHFERRGLGGLMARQLVRIARDADPSITVLAETLAKENPSTRILSKLGFLKIGEIEDPQDGPIWVWKLEA